MNEQLFRAIVGELIDENPFACRALLKILRTEFTDQVPTLAVTTGDDTRLLVNLTFVTENCQTEEHVKAVICHEFLHVLLQHTDRVTLGKPVENLAFDAVINAIIHRELGAKYSDFMLQYYKDETGIRRLLRPWFDHEIKPSGHYSATPGNNQHRIWMALYRGELVADDILDIANDLTPSGRIQLPKAGWLGNHDDVGGPGGSRELKRGCRGQKLSPAVKAALNRALKSMNGDGIWRAPMAGVYANAYRNQVSAANDGVERWRRTTWQVLQKHLLPDPRARKNTDDLAHCTLPVLSPGDRRSFAKALWSPLLPEATWESPRRVNGGAAQVYLDVSGSMNAEMPLIVALLGRLGRHIKRPFWAFSNIVAPAVIKDNRLHADTTGGTSISCVLEHIAKSRPESAVVVTDGYIEQVDTELIKKTTGIRLHALVTRDGSPHALAQAGIPYTQLGRLPQ